MSEKREQAVELFKKGYNCAQAVLCPFASDFQLSLNDAFRISCGFGGGMARTQMTCGAVTGAIMAIGLKYGNPGDEPFEKIKLNTYGPVRAFMEEFKKKYNALDCKTLMGGLDMNNPEEQKIIKEKNLHSTFCTYCVGDAVSILETLFSEPAQQG